MELIIKPTGRCNFNCTFCSAGDMNVKHPDDNKVPNEFKTLIDKYQPNTIIVTGGEPLMMPPEYFYELHNLKPDVIIAPTTNLKDFYLNPEKWKELFNEDWFQVTTSFNYGDTRRWSVNKVFTEDMFLDVMDTYRKYVPNKNLPMFIAVIDESNEDMAIDHILLAKKLNTMCKLNRAIGVGFQKNGYPRYKIMKIYLDIIEAGYDRYEWNCSNRFKGTCPYNINFRCDNSIRCAYIDNNNQLHVGVCDERTGLGYEIPNDKLFDESKYHTKKHISSSDFISPKCAYCELFRLCHGCELNRLDAINDPNYCNEMKKLESRILANGWSL